MDKWATFDCYGTLVDWDSGIASVVGEEQLARYHELEPQVQADNPILGYREVMREVLRRLEFADADAPGTSGNTGQVGSERPSTSSSSNSSRRKTSRMTSR